MLKTIDSIPLAYFIIFSLFPGLAPFFPEPHPLEKIKMLQSGELHKPIDIFDLVLHATPWVLLLVKLAIVYKSRPTIPKV